MYLCLPNLSLQASIHLIRLWTLVNLHVIHDSGKLAFCGALVLVKDDHFLPVRLPRNGNYMKQSVVFNAQQLT